MKRYLADSYRREMTESQEKAALPENPAESALARVVYEWDNALLLAAEKMWGRLPRGNETAH